ncbi:hypothetical protein ACWEFJ_28300 [Actinosynnema sp. NPDC004786]
MKADEEFAARLAEIQARADAATPGPWMVDHAAAVREVPGWHVAVGAPAPAGFTVVALTGTAGAGAHERSVPDAEFIAHARDDVPVLLAEVAQLRARLDAVRALHVHTRNDNWYIGPKVLWMCSQCGAVADRWCDTVRALDGIPDGGR